MEVVLLSLKYHNVDALVVFIEPKSDYLIGCWRIQKLQLLQRCDQLDLQSQSRQNRHPVRVPVIRLAIPQILVHHLHRQVKAVKLHQVNIIK